LNLKSVPGWGAAASLSYQPTPSASVGAEHNGDWNWIVYGMIAFMTARYRGRAFDRDDWEQCLSDGLYCVTHDSTDLVIRECFPTATVNVLKAEGVSHEVSSLLESAEHEDVDGPGIQVAADYLSRGIRGVKRRGPKYDYADSLVAALSSLPYGLAGRFKEQETDPRKYRSNLNWQGGEGDEMREGWIALVHSCGLRA
jgi:hypothetical protein